MMISTKPNSMSTIKNSISQDTFFRLIIVAIILRIAIMPFFGHVDLLSEARRIFFWDQSGIYFDDISRNATSLFQLLFFKVFSIFIENKELMFAHADMTNSTAQPIEYFEFVSQPDIFRTLFIIKLPFLVADLVTAWALYVYCERSAGARRSVVFWLFNPITLYAFYIYGRFEAIPIMFCILGLLALKRDKLLLASVLFGLSINAREMYIFLGPLFVAIVLSPSAGHFKWWVRLAAIAIIGFAVAVSVQLISLSGGSVDAFGREVASIASESRVEYLFQFIVGSFIMFPMVYFFILLYGWNSDAELTQKTFLLFAFVLIAFFCLSSHTAYYTSWMLVFPCVFLSYHKRYFKPLILLCVTWLIFNLSITDLGVFTTWLASPWSINMSGLPNFPMMYSALGLEGLIDLTTFQRLARTMYCACMLYLGFQMLQHYRLQTLENSNA